MLCAYKVPVLYHIKFFNLKFKIFSKYLPYCYFRWKSFFFFVSGKEKPRDDVTNEIARQHQPSSYAPHVRNEPSYANSGTRNSVSVLIGRDECTSLILFSNHSTCWRGTREWTRSDSSRRWYPRLDAIMPSKWYDPIGNTLIYYAYSAIRLNHSHDFARTIQYVSHTVTSAFICLTLWAAKRFRCKTIYRICHTRTRIHCPINFPGYIIQYIFLCDWYLRTIDITQYHGFVTVLNLFKIKDVCVYIIIIKSYFL